MGRTQLGGGRRWGSGDRESTSPAERDAAVDVDANPESVARTICLRLLDSRARTRAELETELARRNVPIAAATTVLDRFTELGLVNDAAFAEGFAQARHHERGQASQAIAVQLRRRGVADEVIADALAQIDPASEAAAARVLAQTRLARMGGVDSVTAARRLTGLLARRGYSSAMTYSAVREALAQQQVAVDDGFID